MTVRMDSYATHLPLLTACVAATQGPVLELGCGLYSTPVLHALCLNRPLTSLEYDAEWLKRFEQFRSARHTVTLTEDFAAAIDANLTPRWSVALIDQQPAATRVPSIVRLRRRVDLFVIHDSHHRLYGYEPTLTQFKYRVEWQRYQPWTTVVSDTMNLDFLRSLL